MKLNRLLSYALGITVGLLAVAPPIPCSIPVIINSNLWLYGFIVSALFGVLLIFKGLPLSLKILIQYLFLGCFISMVPYVSFNAYIMVVGSAFLFLGFLKCEEKIILDFVMAIFILQVFIGTLQMFGVDKLLNFNRPEPVFVGSVCQYMQFGSLLAVLAPLLMLKSKWFIIPIAIVTLISRSSSLGLAVLAGVFVYLFLKHRRYALWLVLWGCLGVFGYYLWDRASFQIALTDGRIPVWGDIVKSWIWDTSRCEIPVARNYINCPVDWKSIFFGRGLDTFLPLFPIFKQDPNPFPQAHNMYLQWIWEIGLLGTAFLMGYLGNLVLRLYRLKEYLYIAGLTCIGVVGFFTFPDRMIQSIVPMICYLAFCEKTARGSHVSHL